jgi:hypothetical protein
VGGGPQWEWRTWRGGSLGGAPLSVMPVVAGTLVHDDFGRLGIVCARKERALLPIRTPSAREGSSCWRNLQCRSLTFRRSSP